MCSPTKCAADQPDDPAFPTKTSNVWHLVCVEPGPFGPGDDYALLTRRCAAFVGVNATSLAIESGTERLGLSNPPYSEQQIAELNGQTIRRALDRDALRRNWSEALALGTLKQMTAGLKADEATLPRRFVLRNTIAALLVQAIMLFFTISSSLMRVFGRIRPEETPCSSSRLLRDSQQLSACRGS